MTTNIRTAMEVRDLLAEVSQAIFALTRSAADPVIEAINAGQTGGVYALMSATGVAPKPVTAADVVRRYPYSALEVQAKPLAVAADLGYLAPAADGEYQLTDSGRAAMNRLIVAFHQRLGEVEPALAAFVSIDALAETANDLRRLADACRTAPIDTWSIQMSHALAAKKPVVALAHIDQAIDDLTAFRDDAHIAAWRPYGSSAVAWELFTFLWRGEVKNAVEFAEKAQRRGHAPDVYAAALAELIDRGWVQATGDEAFILTTSGREIREAAEAETDRLYYAPWAVLTDAQLLDLKERLTHLKAGLAEVAQPVPA